MPCRRTSVLPPRLRVRRRRPLPQRLQFCALARTWWGTVRVCAASSLAGESEHLSLARRRWTLASLRDKPRRLLSFPPTSLLGSCVSALGARGTYVRARHRTCPGVMRLPLLCRPGRTRRGGRGRQARVWGVRVRGRADSKGRATGENRGGKAPRPRAVLVLRSGGSEEGWWAAPKHSRPTSPARRGPLRPAAPLSRVRVSKP